RRRAGEDFHRNHGDADQLEDAAPGQALEQTPVRVNRRLGRVDDGPPEEVLEIESAPVLLVPEALGGEDVVGRGRPKLEDERDGRANPVEETGRRALELERR